MPSPAAPTTSPMKARPGPRRLAALHAYEAQLDLIAQQSPCTHPIFKRLQQTIAEHDCRCNPSATCSRPSARMW
jgi:hypothetical protein